MLDNFTYYKWQVVVIKFSRELISFSMNNHFPTISELVGGLYSIVPTHVVYPDGPHFTPHYSLHQHASVHVRLVCTSRTTQNIRQLTHWGMTKTVNICADDIFYYIT